MCSEYYKSIMKKRWLINNLIHYLKMGNRLPHAKSWLIGKDLDAGRDWGQEEKGTTEDEMAGWHHWLDGREFQWTPGVGDGQGGLACCNSWGRKESDMTEQLIWSGLIWVKVKLLVAQSCPALSHPMDSSPPGASIYEILQARLLQWVAIPFFIRVD